MNGEKHAELQRQESVTADEYLSADSASLTTAVKSDQTIIVLQKRDVGLLPKNLKTVLVGF